MMARAFSFFFLLGCINVNCFSQLKIDESPKNRLKNIVVSINSIDSGMLVEGTADRFSPKFGGIKTDKGEEVVSGDDKHNLTPFYFEQRGSKFFSKFGSTVYTAISYDLKKYYTLSIEATKCAGASVNKPEISNGKSATDSLLESAPIYFRRAYEFVTMPTEFASLLNIAIERGSCREKVSNNGSIVEYLIFDSDKKGDEKNLAVLTVERIRSGYRILKCESRIAESVNLSIENKFDNAESKLPSVSLLKQTFSSVDTRLASKSVPEQIVSIEAYTFSRKSEQLKSVSTVKFPKECIYTEIDDASKLGKVDAFQLPLDENKSTSDLLRKQIMFLVGFVALISVVIAYFATKRVKLDTK
jgi:hypothetical protein